jgi:hypothetical protein
VLAVAKGLRNMAEQVNVDKNQSINFSFYKLQLLHFSDGISFQLMVESHSHKK